MFSPNMDKKYTLHDTGAMGVGSLWENEYWLYHYTHL